jgi:hypothetical protein
MSPKVYFEKDAKGATILSIPGELVNTKKMKKELDTQFQGEYKVQVSCSLAK